MTLVLLAVAALVAGATCLYLRSPNRALAKGLAPGPALTAVGAVALAVALALLLAVMGPAAAVFTWLTGLMLLWTVSPIVIRWLAYRRETAS